MSDLFLDDGIDGIRGHILCAILLGLLNPTQLELHPGAHCFNYNCPHCYGRNRRIAKKGKLLELDEYLPFLDYFSGKERVVDISGITTDPTSFSEIAGLVRAVKERGFVCGVHTKGFRMNGALVNALVENSNDLETFVTLSLDAHNPRQYDRLHGIKNPCKDNFRVVLRSIKDLSRARFAAGDSKLRINIAYLLLKGNSSVDDIDQLLELVGDLCDTIRISLPQMPNELSDSGLVTGFIDNDARNRLEEIKDVFGGHPKISIVEGGLCRPCFEYCWARYFQLVVDAYGNVFPCPQVAESSFEGLSMGNIKNHSIEEIMSAAKKHFIQVRGVEKMGCGGICDRKDVDINGFCEPFMVPSLDLWTYG